MMPDPSDRPPNRGAGRTWVSVLIAAIIIVGILAVAAVGGTAYFFYRHINASFTPPEDANTEFARARARFAGQKPLIEIRKDDEPILHRDASPQRDAPRTPLVALRVLAYDNRARKLVRVSIPFWLLRLAPSGKRVSFLSDNGIDFDSDRVHLTLEDLERRGPGLVLDQANRRGSQVLVWTE
jgi:nitrate reductase NapE component